MPKYSRNGFTLVEMAIVLVIVGLIVGGVLTGKELIRQAQLRAVSKEKTEIHTAIYTFQTKYNGIPGDLATAYNFFGGACGTDTSTIGTGCNGNGNQEIDYRGTGETAKAWEHLGLAKLINGTYTGTGTTTLISVGPNPGAFSRYGAAASPQDDVVVGSETNMMRSKMSNSYWNITDETIMTQAYPSSGFNASIPESYPFPPRGGLYLELGRIGAPSVHYNVYTIPSLTRGEMYVLDQKIDDSKSNHGKMRGLATSGCGDGGGTDYYYMTTGDADDTGICMIGFILN